MLAFTPFRLGFEMLAFTPIRLSLKGFPVTNPSNHHGTFVNYNCKKGFMTLVSDHFFEIGTYPGEIVVQYCKTLLIRSVQIL
jgi:hypothetical protein